MRYRDILDQVANGEIWSVYIDDTGPAGRSLASETLPPDRQSHVAAVFPLESGSILMREMPGTLELLREYVPGTSEFHFGDIYQGKGGYRSLDVSARLDLFGFFAKLVEDHEVSFIVQSLDTRQSSKVLAHFGTGFEALKPAFDTTKPRDLSLLLLLLRVRRYLDEHMPSDRRAGVFADEGWKKNGVGVFLPTFERHFLHGTVFSGRSVDIPGLQFADFGAFLLNRAQLLLGRESLSELDLRVLQVWEKVGSRFVNLDGRKLTVIRPDDGLYRLIPPDGREPE